MRLSELRMGGGGAFPPVPDWKTYKVGPHTPELENVQRMLSSLGLKVIRTPEEKRNQKQSKELVDLIEEHGIKIVFRTPGSVTRCGGLTVTR